jgi:hypothetical protein
MFICLFIYLQLRLWTGAHLQDPRVAHAGRTHSSKLGAIDVDLAVSGVLSQMRLICPIVARNRQPEMAGLGYILNGLSFKAEAPSGWLTLRSLPESFSPCSDNMSDLPAFRTTPTSLPLFEHCRHKDLAPYHVTRPPALPESVVSKCNS